MTAIDAQMEDGYADDNDNKDIDEIVLSEESDPSGYSSQESVSSEFSFVKARAPKSQFQIDAEDAVCRGLDLTRKEFATLRASLKYVYRCLNIGWSMDDFLYKVFDTLHFEQPISDENKAMVCELTRMLARNIDIPYEYISTTFVPLHEFNGGVYTTLSKAMNKCFSIAILVDLVEQVIDATKSGTTQKQGMEFILRGIGLGDDAALMLATTSSNQTLEESVEAGGAALVAKINALPEEHRLKCCIMEISTLRINGGTRVMPRTTTIRSWCSALFDNSPTRSASHTMIADCNMQVAVNVVSHEGSTVDKALTIVHGEDYSVRNAGYRPFDIESGELDASIPLRASTIIDSATPENILKAFKAIVGNDDRHKDMGTQLKSILNAAFFRRHDKPFHLPSGTLIGASYKFGRFKRWLKIGKEKPSDRLASVHISDDKYRPETTSWMVIGEDLKAKEFMNLMTPPWYAYNSGTLDFFIIPPMNESESTEYPEINEKLSTIRTEALSLGHVRDSRAAMAAEKVRTVKKMEILTKPNGRKSTRKLKECELELIELASEEAHCAALEKAIRVPYRPSVYPDWHPKGCLGRRAVAGPHNSPLASLYEEKKRKREEDLEKGKVSKRARDAVDEHRRLRPGGEEYEKARASFEAAAVAM